MLTKNGIRYIQSLKDKKTRDGQRVFVVEGSKMIRELLSSGWDIEQIVGVEESLGQLPELERHPLFRIVSVNDLARVSQLKTPNMVLAVVKQKMRSADVGNGLHLVLDGIQNPGNLGTIIRIADWFGIRSIVASSDTSDMYNPKVVQSTMGSIFRVNISYADLDVFFEKNTLPVYGALLSGLDIHAIGKVLNGIIVIGNESRGIRPSIQSRIGFPITIPRIGKAESLNAAVATGIILSHLV